METKDRIVKNWITSGIGVFFFLFAMALAVKIFFIGDFNALASGEKFINIALVAVVALVGYVFLMAKDSILIGLSLGALKKIGIEEETPKTTEP